MSVRTLRYNTATQHFTKSARASTDRDALAFLEAAQIYNTNQQRAIVNLVRSLKRVGLWSKMKAIYPFVGGTASSHKWNLKDPRDVDAAYRLTFSGGWTHSNSGAKPNGTNATANTNLAHNVIDKDSIHAMGYYSDNIASTGAPALGQNPAGTAVTAIYPSYLSNMYSTVTGSGGSYISQAITDSRAMIIAYRTSSTVHKQKRNNATPIEQTHTSQAGSTENFTIGSGTFGTTIYYNPAQYSMCTIGDGLTDTEATALYNIVDLYQKRLGRAV